MGAVLFAALVLATIAAFFVAQRLKRTPSLLQRVTGTRYISPNADGVRDRAKIRFRVKEDDRLDAVIVDSDGDPVRTLATDRELCGPCGHKLRWNGRTDDGSLAIDGTYFLRVTLRERGRTITSPRKIIVDTKPPKTVVREVKPRVISPGVGGTDGTAAARFKGPAGRSSGEAPKFIVYRTGQRRAVEVARFQGRIGSRIGRWDGRIRGRPAPAGNYLVAVRVRDVAGNVASAPRRLPPRRPETRGRPGVVVSYLAARAPLAPVRPGARTTLAVRAPGRYRWSLRRLGTSRPARRGERSSSRLEFRAPRRPGLYLVGLRSGRHRYTAPLVVAAGGRQRVLVVLPAIDWQAQNPYDADGTGWGERLGPDRSVSLRRPIFGSGLPQDFRTGLAPFLEGLEQAGLRFDLTTDLALTRGSGAGLRAYRGALFAGSERFVPDRLARALHGYAAGGGRVAWLGIDSFHRDVDLTRGALRNPGRRDPEDPFGERTAVRDTDPTEIEILSDRIGLFSEAPPLGVFDRIEPSLSLPGSARTLASAGLEADRPTLVAYRFGRGVVARLGGAGGTAGAGGNPAVTRIMPRLWRLLSS